MNLLVRREQLKLTSLEDLKAKVPEKLNVYQLRGSKDGTVAILEALLEFAPTDEGKRNMAISILGCETDDHLRQLASRYEVGLIISMRASGGRTPRVSDHPSRPSADIDDIMNAWMLEPSKCDRRAMRELVLRRDNYRCLVTGKCDLNSLITEKTKIQEGDRDTTILETAHILPYSLIPSSESRMTKAVVDQSGMIWEVINAFSGIKPEELNGDCINRVENGITLDSAIHTLFGRLSLCFEATKEVNTYKIILWAKPAVQGLLRFPDTITFVPRHQLPTPDPRYLALHAACAKVVHQCGMAEILDKLFDDMEQTAVLSTDGSSAHLLCRALEIIAVS